MANKKIIAMILQAPLVLVMIIAFLASIYLAFNKLYGISYATVVILGIIIVLYFIGVNISRKQSN